MLSRINAIRVSGQGICVRSRFMCKKVEKKSLFTKLSFIGGGNMAEAFIKALHASSLQDMGDVVVNDIHEDRLLFLKEKYGVQISQDTNDAINDADLVILACKPQNVSEVAKAITQPVTGVVLSILAGKTVSDLQEKFSTKLVIRTMPNTPASIMQGVTVWYPANEVSQGIKNRVEQLLALTGTQMLVTSENILDMATAISGTGPAYVFLTIESMIDTAVHIGIPRDLARIMVANTVKGSAMYALASDKSVTDLRYNVTSPGGTTASALYELEKGGYRTVVADAVWAAYRRSLELGDENSNVGPGRSKS